MDVLKFSVDKPDYAVIEQIRLSEPKGVTTRFAECCTHLIETKMRELRFSNPKLDGFTAFEQVAAAFPAAVCIVMTGASEGHCLPELVEADYAEAE